VDGLRKPESKTFRGGGAHKGEDQIGKTPRPNQGGGRSIDARGGEESRDFRKFKRMGREEDLTKNHDWEAPREI